MKPAYAVVKFPVENLIGIICTKWIAADGKHSFYPASKTELFNMTIILKKKKDAFPGWDKHPIIILGQYETYAEAKKFESKAQDTSNLSEDEEDQLMRKRPRKPNTRYEESDTDSECSPSLPTKKPKPVHPAPITFTEESCKSPQSFPSNPNHSSPTSQSITSLSTSHIPENHQLFQSDGSLIDNILDLENLAKENERPESFFTPVRRVLTTNENLSTTFTPNEQHKSNEYSRVMDKLNHALGMISSLHEKFDHFKEELKEINNRINLLNERSISGNQSDKSEDMFSLIPLRNMEEFDQFEEKLIDGSFRKSFIKAMSAVGGRDCHIMIINILRHSLTDQTAQLFSITGKKVGNFAAKTKFLGTRICCSIFDAVRRRYKDSSDDEMKNSVKYWLQQALPRIQKRERRHEAAVDTHSLAPVADPG